MVKIFVGNLSPKVDVDELRALFQTYGKVSECDIIRNYGFVHMDDDEEAAKAFEALNNYTLHGRQVHLEYSTSKLRNKPGMDDVCFRCGAHDHKTHNCPVHDGVKAGGMKRKDGPRDDYPPAKHRANNDYYGNRPNNGGGRYRGGGDVVYGHGRYSPGPPPPRGGSAMYGDYYGRSPSGGAGGVGYEDPIIPRPPDRLLSPLYEEYLNARERYYYYRDRLERELYAMRRTGTVPPVAPAPPPPSARAAYGSLMGSSSYAGAASSGVPSAASLDLFGGRSRSPSSIVRYPELYYARASGAGNLASNPTIYDYDQKPSLNNSGMPAARSLYDPYP